MRNILSGDKISVSKNRQKKQVLRPKLANLPHLFRFPVQDFSPEPFREVQKAYFLSFF